MLQATYFKPRFPRISEQENVIWSQIYLWMANIAGSDNYPGALDLIDQTIGSDLSVYDSKLRELLLKSKIAIQQMAWRSS